MTKKINDYACLENAIVFILKFAVPYKIKSSLFFYNYIALKILYFCLS